MHYSPDGSIEYKGSAFGGALNGALLVTRYSGGKDILVLRTGDAGQITTSETGIAGFTGFIDPVDLIEDPRTGNLYVADLGASKLILLRPIGTGAAISLSTSALTFTNKVGSPPTISQSITITNTGTDLLAIPATGLSLLDADGSLFAISLKPTLPAVIAPGSSITLSIVFNPGNASIGLHTARLQISSNDANDPLAIVNLFGTVTAS